MNNPVTHRFNRTANDPGRARGEGFQVQNANSERDKYAAKDKGKSELSGKGALRPNRAPVKSRKAPRASVGRQVCGPQLVVKDDMQQ